MEDELAQAIKALFANYAQVRDAYYQDIFSEIFDYLDGSGSISTFKNDIKKSMLDKFTQAAETGWVDGGSDLPMDKAVDEWLTAMMNGEVGHIDLLFQTLKQLRSDGEVDKTAEAQRRADGYTQTLDMIYNHAKIAAAGSKMLTFVGDDGKESCTDCKRYKNKRKKASWWAKNDAIPPNRNFECKGYNCHHALVDDEGNVWTL